MALKLAFFLPTEPNEMWDLAVQMGVTEAVTGLPRNPRGSGVAVDYMSLLHLKACFGDAGLKVAVVESSPPMEKIRLGLPGRDEEIDTVSEMLTSMGAAGIPVWCYNFVAVFNWMRTSTTTRTCGGALVTSFDYEAIKNAPLTEAGVVTEEQLWENLEYFL